MANRFEGFSYRGPMPEEPRWWKPGSKQRYEEEYARLVALSHHAPACSQVENLKVAPFDVNAPRRVARITQTPPPPLHVEGGHWSTLTVPHRRPSLKSFIPIKVSHRNQTVSVKWDTQAWRKLGEQIDKYQDNPVLILQPVRHHLHERQWLRDSAIFL